MAQVTEPEAYMRLLEAVQAAEGAARHLGFLREDPRWIRVGGIFAQMREKCVALATKGARQ